LKMASDSKTTPVCDLQQVAFKHDKKIHGRDAFKILNKSLALSYGQFIH